MSNAPDDIIFLYSTHPDAQGAAALGRSLVEAGLAACVNLLPGMQSIYRWQGQIETGAETVMIVKTRADLLDESSQAIRAAHPYVCPCIAAFSVVAGDTDYLEWIRRSCRQQPGPP